MIRPPRSFTIALLLAVAGTLTLSAARSGGARLPAVLAAPAAASSTTVVSGRDYATAVFRDPWDYSNPSDLLLDTGPAQGLGRPVMSGGLLSFTVHSGYVSPLWAGYKSEVPTGREGTVTANTLDAHTYTRLHVHIYVSAFTAAGLSWSACSSSSGACSGSMTFALRAGWNDVDLPIVRSHATGRAWTGRMQGLRFALTAPRGTVSVHLDSLRIYQASRAAAFAWSAPGRSPATLWWTDAAGTIRVTAGPHAGQVANAAASASSAIRVGANVAGYPPRTYFWSVAADGSKTLVGQTAASPLPVIDTPSAAGCKNYRGHPWTFTSSRSLAGHANAAGLGFSAGGVLTATNAAPHPNDPNITLPLSAGGINGRVYHRLTIVESYDGRFNLANAPGGGTMARILWQSSGHVALSQTAPLVTYGGKRTITLDLAGQVIERAGSAAQRYPFASTSPVIRLRYDPNEDPGARHWQLYSVRLAADCQAGLSSVVSWHDAQYSSGSTVRLEARTAGGHTHPLGSSTEHAGSNSLVVSVRSVPRGTYTVAIYVTNPGRVSAAAVSSGPLVISR